MPIAHDWRFLVTLLLTVASVIVPVWLWHADLSSKGLTLTIKSTADLQPERVGTLAGLQVLIDGQSVANPFVSVMELSNSGAKPVLGADFERPLKVVASEPSQIVKAQISSTVPASLSPRVEVIGGSLLVYPLLMNPGDTLKFTVITANAKPSFFADGRIAGVQDVTLRDAQSSRTEKRRWAAQLVACLLLVVYSVNIAEAIHAAVRKREFLVYSVTTGLIAVSGAILLYAFFSIAEGIENLELWPLIPPTFVISAAVLVARRIRWRDR